MKKSYVRGAVLASVLLAATLVFLLLFVQSSLASNSDPQMPVAGKAAGQPVTSSALAAGIVVTPTSGLVTTESGGQAAFYVYLTSRPSNPVRIFLQNTDISEGVLSIVEVNRNSGNWSVPVLVSVTGVDDMLLDGNITYTIVTLPAQSNDPNYNGLNADDVSVTNMEDDFGPIAHNDLDATNEDSPIIIDVLANDVFITPPLTVTIIDPPATGTATVNPDSTITYSPYANIFGQDAFEYSLCDSTGRCDPASVNLTIYSVNDLPVANNDAATLAEETNATISVLFNDTDADGDPLSITNLNQPSHGAAAVVAGQVVYTPTTDFFGNDSIAYAIGDGNGGTDTATVAITVTQVQDFPVAVNDYITTNENVLAHIQVLVNDFDPDMDPVFLQSYQAISTQGGVIGRDARGTPADYSDDWLLYTPAFNTYGSDSFWYLVSDGILTDTAIVSITINPSQPQPVANDDAFITDDNTTLFVTSANGLLANDVPGSGGQLTAVLVSNPTQGVLSLEASGAFTYTPNLNYFGIDSFQYLAQEGHYTSPAATVMITIDQVNIRPVATNDVYEGSLGQTLTVTVPGVLENDSDGDNDVLSAVLKSPPSRGQVTLNPDGSFIYTPNNGSVTTDSFSYQAFDGMLYSPNATVRIDLKDTRAPTVTWVSPVPNGGIYNVENEIVRLEVDVQDNVAVQRVIFFRWDAIKQLYIDIQLVTSAPFAINFDTSALNLGWNQIFARAYDSAGNPSTFPFIFLYKVENKNLFNVFLPISMR